MKLYHVFILFFVLLGIWMIASGAGAVTPHHPINPLKPWRVYLNIDRDGKLDQLFLTVTYGSRDACESKILSVAAEVYGKYGGMVQSPWGTRYPVISLYCKADGEVA